MATRRLPPAVTARECEILSLVRAGMSNRQVARTLGISEKTVKNHLYALYPKIGVHSRVQAARYSEPETTRSKPAPLPSLSPLPLGRLRAAVVPAVARATQAQWGIDDVPWATVQAERLTDRDRDVVRFITFIEDHIPGYLTWLLELFPVVGEQIDIEEFCVNREYFRFIITWAADEERHAAVLTRYQLAAGMADGDDLLRELAVEGRKRFQLPYEHPLQAFTYTLVQEKATQLFYQRFRAVAGEPVLRGLLHRLARDEARHFAFYAQMVEAYLQRDGVRAVPHLKDVLRTFAMPLAETLTGYWRWSLRVADAVAYDHTEAYESLVRMVTRLAGSRGEAGVDDLLAFVLAVRRLP